MKEKRLIKIVWEFEDGSKTVLRDRDAQEWEKGFKKILENCNYTAEEINAFWNSLNFEKTETKKADLVEVA